MNFWTVFLISLAISIISSNLARLDKKSAGIGGGLILVIIAIVLAYYYDPIPDSVEDARLFLIGGFMGLGLLIGSLITDPNLALWAGLPLWGGLAIMYALNPSWLNPEYYIFLGGILSIALLITGHTNLGAVYGIGLSVVVWGIINFVFGGALGGLSLLGFGIIGLARKQEFVTCGKGMKYDKNVNKCVPRSKK